MSNIQETYAQAKQYHRAGQLQLAEPLYRRILQADSAHADVHYLLGALCEGSGRLEEAEAHLRQAARLRPLHVESHNHLGVVRAKQGRTKDAITSFQRALRLRPNFVEALKNLGVTFGDHGNLAEAAACFQRVIDLCPDDFQAYDRLGIVLTNQSKLNEAVACFQQALRIKPDFSQAHGNLANALRMRGALAEAVAHGHQAVRIAPDSAESHIRLGALLAEQGKFSEALACSQRATEIPAKSAVAHCDLGHFQLQIGQLHEAEASFRAALNLDSRNAPALAALATMHSGALPDAELAALEARSSDDEMGQRPRATLLFALAQVLDGRGEYARAADCLKQANALSLELAYEPYDPATHARFVDELLRAFDAEFFARFAGLGLNTERPVFVFGLPRSGTTLIEQVLASHSQVHGAGELPLGQESFDALPGLLGRGNSPIDSITHLDAAALRSLADRHSQRLRTIDDGRALRIVDKMPGNYSLLGLLAVMFPRATFIHCRRDPRDTALSCWMADFSDVAWASHPEHIASNFRQYDRLMEHWETTSPVTIHHVDYEEAVADLESVARRLVAACGLDWEPACLEFHRTQRLVRTASARQVRQPAHQQSVARWKKYESVLAELFAAVSHEPCLMR